MALVSIRLNLFTCPSLEQENYKVYSGDVPAPRLCQLQICCNVPQLGYIFFLLVPCRSHGLATVSWLSSRVMSACFDRKISFSGCNGVAGVPYFQTDRCGGKMNDDSSTVKNCHASLGKIIMQNLNTLHQFNDESC
ncbi:hypothetical protein T08_1173 [Trichinella sp. T8]|nr:hypothetical protein T08_1173 [Trichinella sp. T8]